MTLLDEHAEVISSGEMHLLSRPPVDDPIVQMLLRHDSHKGARFTLESILDDSEALTGWLAKGNDHWRSLWGATPHQHVELARQELVRFLFEMSTARALANSPKRDVRWIFDKSPVHATDFYESFNRCFQNSERAVVHLVRDPRDVAISRWYHLRAAQFRHLQHDPACLSERERQSCFELLAGAEDQLSRERHFFTVEDFLRRTCREWAAVNVALYEESRKGQCPYLLIRYEDVRKDRAVTMTKLHAFLGLDPANSHVVPVGDANGSRPLRPSTLRKGTGGEWRRWFNENDHLIVQEECGHVMSLFGYDAASR